MKKTHSSRGMAALCLALALLLVCGAAYAEEATPYAAIYGADNPVPEIAKRVRPAVVQVINIVGSWDPYQGEQSEEQGYGSGVYIDERGYVVTNYHVVKDADKLEVLLLDGARVSCKLVGYDDGTDIAVLELAEQIDTQPVPMGDSDQLQIGELAIAIGNPGDAAGGVLMGTVTAGIISALDRDTVNADNFTRRVGVIQTDAAINTGNSGGALLNAKGELIGIPTLKMMFDAETVYEGLGFAVPISKIRPVIEQIIDKGRYVRPRLGIMIESFEGPNEPLPNYPPAGARVMTVDETGAAAQSGVILYDIITAIDGVRVKSSDDVLAEIDRHVAGDVIKVSVYRCFNLIDQSLIPEPQSLDFDLELRILD